FNRQRQDRLRHHALHWDVVEQVVGADEAYSFPVRSQFESASESRFAGMDFDARRRRVVAVEASGNARRLGARYRQSTPNHFLDLLGCNRTGAENGDLVRRKVDDGRLDAYLALPAIKHERDVIP